MKVEDFSMLLKEEEIWHLLFRRKMPNSSENNTDGIFWEGFPNSISIYIVLFMFSRRKSSAMFWDDLISGWNVLNGKTI